MNIGNGSSLGTRFRSRDSSFKGASFGTYPIIHPPRILATTRSSTTRLFLASRCIQWVSARATSRKGNDISEARYPPLVRASIDRQTVSPVREESQAVAGSIANLGRTRSPVAALFLSNRLSLPFVSGTSTKFPIKSVQEIGEHEVIQIVCLPIEVRHEIFEICPISLF